MRQEGRKKKEKWGGNIERKKKGKEMRIRRWTINDTKKKNLKTSERKRKGEWGKDYDHDRLMYR